jgi:hypothetical protein
MALELENRRMYYENWDCSDSDTLAAMQIGRTTAIDRAAFNEYIIDEDITDHQGVITECGIEDHGVFEDRYIDLTVDLSTTTTTSFAHLLFPDVLRSQVEAVARIRPRQPLAHGFAIVALNPEACSGHNNGAIFHGTADVYVNGGGVFTNGCLNGDGQPIAHVTDGEIYWGNQYEPGNASFEPSPQQTDFRIDPAAYAVETPNCSDPRAHNVNDLRGTLEPGLYCINNNLMINAHDVVIGNGVTIYVPNGYVHIDGNATVQLSAPQPSPDPSPAIAGLLFYMPPENNNDLSINGNSESWFQGTVLAPGGVIDVEGNGVINAYRVQVIGWDVQVGGTADAWVSFDPNYTSDRPTFIELFR